MKLNKKLITGLLGLGLMAAGSASAQDAIRIGVLMPTSGGGASYGLPLVDGIQVAADRINAAGGINGVPVEFVVRDTQLKADVATAAMKELITKEGITIFIGAVSSGVTIALSQLAKDEEVVLFAPASQATSLTRDHFHKYIFQEPETTDVEGRHVAEILSTMGAEKVCFTGYDYVYTHDVLASIKSNLADGIEVQNEFIVPIGSTDFTSLISNLVANNCDSLVGSLWGGGFIAFAKQAGPFGLFDDKKLIWTASVGSSEMTVALGADYPEGTWASAYDLWYHEGSEHHSEFQAALAELQGTEQTAMFSIMSYNALNFIAEAISIAGSDDPDAVVEALEGLTIGTPLGERTIDSETHRVNTGQFWGKIVSVEGSSVKRMSPAEYRQ